MSLREKRGGKDETTTWNEARWAVGGRKEREGSWINEREENMRGWALVKYSPGTEKAAGRV